MHRPHRPHRTVGAAGVGETHTGYTGMSDGVSRCGKLFDLTDYGAYCMGAVRVGGTTKSTTIFLP